LVWRLGLGLWEGIKMQLTLYGHPFSSFTEKVLVALYETDTSFTFRQFGAEDPAAQTEWEALSPFKRFPVLVDDGTPFLETSIIIEHLQQRQPGRTRLIPDDAAAALEVRFMDRVFDNYVMTPMLTLAFNQGRSADTRDAIGIDQARSSLDNAYAWLDERLAGRTWAAGETFSLADCAAAPALLFAHWAHPIPATLRWLTDYRQRLRARPSFARVIEEARPYRSAFPFPASD
jgi:glutathione S-transferase